MKKLTPLLFVMVFAATMGTFTSCKSDDSDTPKSVEEQLVGIWEYSDSEYWTFHGDGSFVSTAMPQNEETLGTYSYNEETNRVEIFISDDNYSSNTLHEITPTNLLFRIHDLCAISLRKVRKIPDNAGLAPITQESLVGSWMTVILGFKTCIYTFNPDGTLSLSEYVKEDDGSYSETVLHGTYTFKGDYLYAPPSLEIEIGEDVSESSVEKCNGRILHLRPIASYDNVGRSLIKVVVL